MPDSQETTSEVGLGLKSLATGEWSVVINKDSGKVKRGQNQTNPWKKIERL